MAHPVEFTPFIFITKLLQSPIKPLGKVRRLVYMKNKMDENAALLNTIIPPPRGSLFTGRAD